MLRWTRHKVAIGAILATAAGGGVAWAATSSDGDPRSEYLAAVAKRLDVSPEKLNGALKGAYLDQVDKALKDGRLTKEQADALKRRVEDGKVPFGLGRGIPGQEMPRHGFGHRFGHGHGSGPFGSTISAAAKFLGISESELQTQLRSGTTLAGVAKQKGKPVDDLVDAIVAAERKQLDEAVDDKRITSDQRDMIAEHLPARVRTLVEGGPRAGAHHRRPWADAAPARPDRPAPPAGAEL